MSAKYTLIHSMQVALALFGVAVIVMGQSWITTFIGLAFLFEAFGYLYLKLKRSKKRP